MTPSRRGVLATLGTAAAAIAGCSDSEAPGTSTKTYTAPPARATYEYTHLQASGNRVLAGEGAIPETEPVDVPVDGTPAWLLAFGAEASHWTVVTADGRAVSHRVEDGTSEVLRDHGTVWRPPLGYQADGAVDVVGAPPDCAAHTHPVPIEDGVAYVAADGDLVIRRGSSRTRLDAEAPVDARLVAIDDDRYALYGSATDRYRHGALGDTTEGGSLLVVDVASAAIDVTTTLSPPTAFEGLSPLVADLDGDGATELVTTIADAGDGARIRVYDVEGSELATGPVYGPGWRHQLCVAPIGPGGETELAVVRKPHVDRTVEFYGLRDGQLTITATRQGYASHTYGSRNVEGGLAADLDGNGQPELLVPTSDRRTLAALRRIEGGVEPAFSLALDGSLRTNVTGVRLEDGRLAVGAGTASGVRVWQG